MDRAAHVCRIARPVPEHDAAATRLRRDIALAVKPLVPDRGLSAYAVAKLETALREAAGAPDAAIWTEAIGALNALVEAAEAAGERTAAVARLRRFVDENG